MLTVEEQKTIENSIWVVNAALKEQGLSADEDLRQNAILYMCLCLSRFNASLNVKWTTFAYKNVYLYIKRLHNKDLKRHNMEVGEELMPTLQAVESGIEAVGALNEDKLTIDRIKSVCTPKECLVIDLRLQGYKLKEIGEKMGCSKSMICSHMKSIRQKASTLK